MHHQIMFEFVVVAVLLLAAALATPHATPHQQSWQAVCPQCGHGMRSQFLFYPNFTTLNHGAYGATPRPVVEAQQGYVLEEEGNIESWINGASGYRGKEVVVRQMVAQYVNASADDVVLIENASGAINALLRSLPLKRGDVLLDFSTAYGPFKSFYAWLEQTMGVVVLEVPVVFPLQGPESMLQPLAATLAQNHSQITIAVVSHVASYPGVILPVKEVIAACHAYGIPVIVDGAHAFGAIPIDIGDMDPDYYFGNGHKWLFSPRGSAFLYVKHELQQALFPAPAVVDSIGMSFVERFVWTGTRDYTAFCAMKDAFAFRASLGGDAAVMGYNQGLAKWAGHHLAATWKTFLLAPDSMQGTMTNVVVPTKNNTACAVVVGRLLSEYGIMVSGAGSLDASHGNIACFFRLSAQVYLEQSDFELVGRLVPELLRQQGALGM